MAADGSAPAAGHVRVHAHHRSGRAARVGRRGAPLRGRDQARGRPGSCCCDGWSRRRWRWSPRPTPGAGRPPWSSRSARRSPSSSDRWRSPPSGRASTRCCSWPSFWGSSIAIATTRGRAGSCSITLPVVALWINLHGGWVVGVAAVVLHALEQLLRRRPARHLIAAVAATPALMALTPYGRAYYVGWWRSITFPRDRIGEWAPLFRSPYVIGLCAFGLAVLFVVYAVARRGVRRSAGPGVRRRRRLGGLAARAARGAVRPGLVLRGSRATWPPRRSASYWSRRSSAGGWPAR